MGLKAPPVEYPDAKQAEMKSGGQDCPCCGRPWEGMAVRVCRKCGGVLGRGHRYKMVPAGRALVAFEHYNCENTRSKT